MPFPFRSFPLTLATAAAVAGSPVDPPQAPAFQPPPPPARIPPPPGAGPSPAPVPDRPGGQWVLTVQYGWVWMPEGERFLRAAGPDLAPTRYVFTPAAGWCWVRAPWIRGWRPRPWYGPGVPPGRCVGWSVSFGSGYAVRGGWRVGP